MNIIFLEITSYQGISAGAEHYYGKLIGENPYTVIDLEKRLTSKEAKALSKKDDYPYRAGSKTERFDTKDEIIALAISEYKTHFPSADILITGGSHASVEPKKILDGPSDLMQKANAIYDEYKTIPWERKYGFYDLTPDNRKKSGILTRQWDELFKATAQE